MSGVKVPVLLTVLAGRFDSQPEAFAQLTALASRMGLKVDLASVDVIRSAPEVRLAHYFRPQIVARIQELQGGDDTVVVLRPSPLTARRDFPGSGTEFRTLGRFAGEIVDLPDRPDWA